MGERDETTGKLDLGLSELLSEAPAERASSAADSEGEKPEAADTVPQEEPREESRYEQLARGAKWGELATLCERTLERGDDVEARLWWIRAHLEGGSMPAAFLAAPFEAVCSRVTDESIRDPQLLGLLSETARPLLERLKQGDDSDHARSIEEQLSKIEPPVGTDAPTFEQHVVRPSSAPPVDAAPLATTATLYPRHTIEKVKRGSSLGTRAFLVVALLCFAAATAVVVWMLPLPSLLPLAEVSVAEEQFIAEPHDLELVLPSIVPRDRVNTLSSLFYDIQRDGLGTPLPSPSDSQGQSSVTSTETATVKKPKERVDTSGPIEGPEFRERRLRFEGRPPLQAPRRSGEPSGRPAPRTRSNSSGIHYVLTRTSVLSEPNYKGTVLAELKRGDRVYVEARLGRWVRLKSIRGRGGFVLAEDIAAEYPGRR